MNRWSRRTWGLIAIALALAGLFAYVVARSGPLAPLRVTVTTVEPRRLEPRIAGVGTVQARQVHRVGPIVAGRLRRVAVEPGDTVAAGQVLAELDPVDLDERLRALQASADRAEAQLGEHQARYAYAAAQVRRYDELFAARLVSEEQATARRQELRVAESALAAGRQERERTRAERAAVESQRESLVLRSPVDGLVAGRGADPGTTVVAGQSVVEIIDPDEVWLDVRFDQIGAGGLAPGLPAVVELRSREGERFEGVVARVEPRADPVTEETMAKVAFAKKPEPLPPLGEIVLLTVRLPARDAAVAVPAAALHRREHATGVWRVGEGGLEFVPVRPGVTDLDGYVEIVDGLEPGDRVVQYSEAGLADGRRIREVAALSGAAR